MTATARRALPALTPTLPRRALAGTAFAAGLAVALVAHSAGPAAAQALTAPPRQIAVQGEGQASAAPTEAFVSGGVQIQGRTAREAMDGNARTMRQVQEALRQAGIADRDVSSSALNLQPQVEYPSGGRPRVTGYVAGHRLRVRLRDLAALGDVLDRMVGGGMNQIDGLQLSVPDWSAKVDEAREAAVADARRKAEVLAKAAGARLGKVLSITESGGSVPAPMAVARQRSASYSSEAVPVASGDQTFRLSVSISWELVD